MQPLKNISGIILFAIFVFASCNPTKDKWANRKFHTLTGHYNIYFNGEQKLLQAIQQIEATHQNNFNKILDVFPMGTPEAAKSAGNLLDEAIKKFSGAVQLHTVGSYTDDAYYSLGICRFYKQDYFAAIETYQYIIGRYKDSEFANKSTCWIARCYVGLEKIGEAEAIMGQLLAKKDLPKKDIGLIYAAAAEINIQMEKYLPAIENLKIALTGKLSKDQKVRYNYILGQLCFQANKKPEATYYFNKVISSIPTYDFAFNANISLTKIYNSTDKRSVAKVRKNLKKMARDDKNLDYLDQIYFELGRLELSQKNMPAAINCFQTSCALSSKNKNQKSFSYYELAKIFFDQKDFKRAQAYYDSTVQIMDPKWKFYESIKETKIVLSELITNLIVFENEDSLQRLANLSKDELERKIDTWIAEDTKKKEQDAKLAKKRAKDAMSVANNQNFIPSSGGNVLPDGGSTSWYFYNPPLMASGAAEFFSAKRWGQRANDDYWRIASKEKQKTETQETTQSDGADTISKIKEAPKKVIETYKPVDLLTGNQEKDKWIKNVPFTSDQKKSSNLRMLEALHNLGLLYYDRLKNYTESIKYFEFLEKKYPLNEYEPDAFFYLYKNYSALRQTKPATQYKEQLIKQYPESPYSLLVENKYIKSAETDNNKALVAQYERMYEAYKNNNFTGAMSLKNEIDKNFPGNILRPKYELLNAFCIGRTQSKEAFKTALTSVSNNFKETDVAKTAIEYLAVINREEKREEIIGKDSTLNDLNFDIETETQFYYLFAIKNDKADFTDYVSKFTSYNEAYASDNNLKVNAMLSNEGFQYVLIREFQSFSKANDYKKGIKATEFITKQLLVSEPYLEYVISSINLKNVLKEKKLEKFNLFYQKQEEKLNTKK